MKKLLFVFGLLAPLSLLAQLSQDFEVTGKIDNARPVGKIYLFYNLGANQVVDSSSISLGAFTIKGTILNPVPAIVAYDHVGTGLAGLDKDKADYLPVYLEAGTIKLTAMDSIARAKIIGSPLNDDNQLLTGQVAVIKEKARLLGLSVSKAPADKQLSPDFQNNVQLQYKKLQIEQERLFKTFITQHPKSYISLLALSSLGGPNADPQLLDALYNLLDPSLKNLEAGKQLRNSLDKLKVTAVGAMAPDFSQPDVNGNLIKLSSFRGKYVLIDFWASWCGPCRQENPNVVKAFNIYKDKNFTILGVSLDRPGAKAAWQGAIKSDRLDWTQVSDLKGWENTAAATYFVSSIPQNYLIDPQGKIIAKNLRGEELNLKLQQIFTTTATPKSE